MDKNDEQNGVALFTCNIVTISLTFEQADGDKFSLTMPSLAPAIGLPSTRVEQRAMVIRRKSCIVERISQGRIETRRRMDRGLTKIVYVKRPLRDMSYENVLGFVIYGSVLQQVHSSRRPCSHSGQQVSNNESTRMWEGRTWDGSDLLQIHATITMNTSLG